MVYKHFTVQTIAFGLNWKLIESPDLCFICALAELCYFSNKIINLRGLDFGESDIFSAPVKNTFFGKIVSTVALNSFCQIHLHRKNDLLTQILVKNDAKLKKAFLFFCRNAVNL